MAKCYGCGIKLQYEDENKAGYVPFEVINSSDKIYCKRCFQIIHNGKKYVPSIDSNNYYEKIKVIGESKALVILILDVMDIFGGFIPNLSKYIGKAKVLLVINKVDVLPKDVHLKKIEECVKKIALDNDLNVIGVSLISAKNKKNVKGVIDKIYNYKEYLGYKRVSIKNTYVVGCASVGKSTFINAVKELYLNDHDLLTTSDQFQTTMDFIKIPLDKDHFLIDTPGLINYSSFGAYLDYESIKVLTPKSYIKPRTYQLNGDQTIFLGGLVRIDFISDEKINASFYVSNDLYLHRTKTVNADNLYETQVTRLLTPPSATEAPNLKNLKKIAFVSDDGSKELLISGIGFVHISGKSVTLRVIVNENIEVKMVESFI